MIDATGCTITLYTQNGCPDSALLRTWLADHGISFTERNVTNNPEAVEALARSSIFATPLITICSHKVFGNRPVAIAQTIEACEFRTAA